MTTLVAYASRYGATQGIAERIAAKLEGSGGRAQVRPVSDVGDVLGYDAFVIGSGAYMGRWLKEATEFVRSNQALLATRPVWLFSSGPLGTATKDAKGRDLLTMSEPKEFKEFQETIKPRATCVFFGAMNPSKLGFSHRAARLIPAARAVMPEGDFRDWAAIEAWAASIAVQIPSMLVSAGA